MKNRISSNINNACADGGQVYTNKNGDFAVVSMGEARLFFDSPGEMASMAHLLLDLAAELAEKQKEQGDV